MNTNKYDILKNVILGTTLLTPAEIEAVEGNSATRDHVISSLLGRKQKQAPIPLLRKDSGCSYPVLFLCLWSILVTGLCIRIFAWFFRVIGGVTIFSANVCDHRHRTAGATDAGEERVSASGVTAGRCSVDRSVRIILL